MALTISENNTLSAQLLAADGVTVAVRVNVSIDRANKNMSVSVQTVNQELAIANASSIKSQFNDFMTVVQQRAVDCGLTIY